MLNGQIAQAMLRLDGEAPRPHLEVPIREHILIVPELEMEVQSNYASLFGDWRGSTVLCACGALVHLD